MSSNTIGAVLNIPTIVPTSRGPVAVRELSVVASVQAIDRLLICLRAFRASTSEDGLGKLVDTLREDPFAVIDVVALTTDCKAAELRELALAEFLDVGAAFIKHNEGLIHRFLQLGDQITAVVQRATAARSSLSSTDSSRAAGPSPTSES